MVDFLWQLVGRSTRQPMGSSPLRWYTSVEGLSILQAFPGWSGWLGMAPFPGRQLHRDDVISHLKKGSLQKHQAGFYGSCLTPGFWWLTAHLGRKLAQTNGCHGSFPYLHLADAIKMVDVPVLCQFAEALTYLNLSETSFPIFEFVLGSVFDVYLGNGHLWLSWSSLHKQSLGFNFCFGISEFLHSLLQILR